MLNDGRADLDAAVDLRGTCERMCSEQEIRTRERTMEVHPFEAVSSRSAMDDALLVTDGSVTGRRSEQYQSQQEKNGH